MWCATPSLFSSDIIAILLDINEMVWCFKLYDNANNIKKKKLFWIVFYTKMYSEFRMHLNFKCLKIIFHFHIAMLLLEFHNQAHDYHYLIYNLLLTVRMQRNELSVGIRVKDYLYILFLSAFNRMCWWWWRNKSFTS